MPGMSVYRSSSLNEELHSAQIKGLTVFVLPKKGFRRKYAEAFVRYGSNDNAFVVPGQDRTTEVPAGVAHFLEHKMFEKEWGDALTGFSALGGSGNAYTASNYTSYMFYTLDNFGPALELLLEVVFKPHFTAESVEREAKVIAQEIRMYNDVPGARLMRATMEALYLVHPVRLDIAGTEESISHIDKDLLSLCHKTFYTPGNMSLFVAGDVHPARVFESVSGMLSAPDSDFRQPERVRPGEPDRVGPDSTIPLPVPTPLLQVGWKGPVPGGDGLRLVKSEISLALLMDIMFGRSSGWFSQVYEDALADDLSYSSEVWPDYSFVTVASQSMHPYKLADRIREEVERARQHGIDAGDFARAKKAAAGRYVALFDSFDSVGESQVHLNDVGLDIFAYRDILEEINLESVTAALDFLDNDRSVRVIVENGRG